MAYIMESELGAQTIINSKMVDYYGGCGYLGFQVHPEVIHAACEATKKYGISSATTTAGFGNNPVLIDLEEKISLFFEAQSVLHYASGCLGNFIMIEGLKNLYDLIFIDSQAHYSIKNATSLVQKPEIEFQHRDPQDLKDKIHQFLLPHQRPLIISDGIFPISGEISPVNDYAEVLKNIEGAIICLDDAHATGVIGKKGFGTFEYFGMTGPNLYSAGVFSKALGGHGGVITGDTNFIKTLKKNSVLANACSSTPIPAAAATAKALEILHNHPEIRTKLWENTLYAKNAFRNIGFHINHTPVPIICLSTRRNLKKPLDCERIQKELFDHNIAVTHVPGGAYTSVPPSGALRIAIFNSHSHDQIDHLVHEIQRLL